MQHFKEPLHLTSTALVKLLLPFSNAKRNTLTLKIKVNLLQIIGMSYYYYYDYHHKFLLPQMSTDQIGPLLTTLDMDLGYGIWLSCLGELNSYSSFKQGGV